jgi:CRP-like cAMP-binding protein
MASVSATRNSSPPRNQLLAAMSATDFASLQPHLQPVPMALLKDMERPNRRIKTVYFMESGIASVVAVQPDETQVEVGLIGREGMSGIAVVLGGDQSPHSTYIQIAGEGQRITASELRKAINASQTLQSLLLKFVQVFMVQTAHTAILSLMLGVRRAGVTEALHSLKRQKLIDNGRNKIVVLNRKGIERAAGKSYGTPEKEYRRLIG